MKLLLCALCLLLGLTSIAQNKELIQGKWVYEDVLNKENMDSIGLKMAAAFFKDMYMIFQEDGAFAQQMLGKPATGRWNLTEQGEAIRIDGDKGDWFTMKIYQLTEEELHINFGSKQGAFLMKKADLNPEDKVTPMPINPNRMSATKEQLCKQWYLISTDSPEWDEQKRAIAQSLAKGNTYLFNSNGKHKSFVLKVDMDAKWELGPENKSIITKDLESDAGVIWNILEISEHELIVTKGNSKQRLVLSDQKP